MKANHNQKVTEWAAYFVMRLYSGELSAAEEKQISNWRREDKMHEEEFRKMLSLWELSINLPISNEIEQPTPPRKSWIMVSAAASVCFAVIALYLLLQPEVPVEIVGTEVVVTQEIELADEIQNEIYTEQRYIITQPGKVDTLALSDGSVVTLNGASIIEIDFTEQQRHVVMQEGEAFFDVAVDALRPFVIDIENKRIRVLGTKFNVQKFNGDLYVAVVEGTVSVSKTQELYDESDDVNELTDYVLEAGSVGSFSATEDVIVPSSHTQVTEAQNWRKGVFRFDDESLDIVVDEFNRYRSTKLRIVDSSVANLRISGVFYFGEGTGLVDALRATLPIEITEVDNEMQIRMARPKD